MKPFLRSPLNFIILMGIVSLFGDVTYEGARSVNGSFLAFLGASGTVVGIVAGAGELIGYGIRLISGYLTDRTQRYWLITTLGYSINMIAVPLLALAGHWPTAAALMIFERLGKAIRTPARDAMIASAGQQMGRGWAFAIHEALDQIGAVSGPLIVSLVYYFKKSYAAGYATLLIPAICALTVLLTARSLYPKPSELEVKMHVPKREGFSRRFWLYLAAVSLVAFGYADFPLIAFHWQKQAAFPPVWIPVFYSLAMAVDAVSALYFGRLFDKKGLSVLTGLTAVCAFFAPFAFSGNFWFAAIGMSLWGIGMGAQESIMRAAVSDMVDDKKRATAFGIFNTGYGLAWFAGSAIMGLLYDHSVSYLIVFSVIAELAAVPVFIRVSRKGV